MLQSRETRSTMFRREKESDYASEILSTRVSIKDPKSRKMHRFSSSKSDKNRFKN